VRSVGSEFLSVATVLSIPLGIVLVFPFGAFGFKATEEVRHPVRTAFVTLTPEAERLAERAVRASWQGKADGARRLRADLLSAELPQDARLSVLSARDRSRPPSLLPVRCEWTLFLPSQKAPPPVPIAPEKTSEPLAFPREELLKLN